MPDHGAHRDGPRPRPCPSAPPTTSSWSTSSWPAGCSASPSTATAAVDLDAIAGITRAHLPPARRGRPRPRPLHPRGLQPRAGAQAAHPGPLPAGGGQVVNVRTVAGTEAGRRLRGTLVAADDDGITVGPTRRPGGDPRAPSATTRWSGPAPCSSGAPPPSPAAQEVRHPRPPRRRQRSHDAEARHDGGPPGPGRRPGHLLGDADGRPGRRHGVGLQPHARGQGVRLGHHRPRHLRHPGLVPGASTRTASPSARSPTSPRPTSAASRPRPPAR